MKKIVLILTSFFSLGMSAQEKEKPRVDFTANLQTNHLWRGLVISDKPITAVYTAINLDKEGVFKVGTWGGMAMANREGGQTQYKEVDYFVQYSKNGLTVALWDLFNDVNDRYGKGIWNYNARQSGHILDLRTSYYLGKELPLTIEADVFLFGMVDRENDNTKQRYSTYVQAAYDIDAGREATVSPFVGVGFSLSGETHIYGKNKFDLVNVGFTTKKTFKLSESYSIPVSVTSMWNPSLKHTRVQLAATVF